MSTNATWERIVSNEPEWRELFDEQELGPVVPGQCPACGANALKRFFEARRPFRRVVAGRQYVAQGQVWEWCSGCRRYVYHHGSLIPEWWDAPDPLDDEVAADLDQLRVETANGH